MGALFARAFTCLTNIRRPFSTNNKKGNMDSTKYILELIDSFPCLRMIVRPQDCLTKAHHEKPSFDPDKFLALMDCASSGQRLCAKFVVNVWNPTYAKMQGWDFDLFDFVGTADRENKMPVLDWMQNPRWP